MQAVLKLLHLLSELLDLSLVLEGLFLLLGDDISQADERGS